MGRKGGMRVINGMAPSRLTASVVVAAHMKEHALPRLLDSLIGQDLGGIRLHVIVSVNGSTDRTAAVASDAIAAFAAHGHLLEVLDLPIASKAAALNAADRASNVFPRVYLDADIQLSPTAIRRVVDELSAVDEPRLAAPSMRVVRNRSLASRHYGTVWGQLPYIREQVPGVGFYAVNRAGRARWWRFPIRLGADDKFVRLNFGPGEVAVLPDAWFEVYLPERLGELLRVRGRWTSFNRDLARVCPGLERRDTLRWRSSASHVVRTPSTWPFVPGFLTVWFGGWLVAVGHGRGSRGWATASSSAIRALPATNERWPAATSGQVGRRPGAAQGARSTPAAARACAGASSRSTREVHAVVVTHNSGAHALRCVSRLLASTDIESIRVTVVDNASTDGTSEALASTFTDIEVIHNKDNIGFAGAVNQGLESSTARWIAIVNPDVEVNPTSIAASVAHLEQNQDDGICCVPAVDAKGEVNDRSFFSFPTVWSEVTLAMGLHRMAIGSRWLNPEQYLARQELAEPTPVDAIAGCFTVIDRTLWVHLGGYDERYFLCGEDLDLSMRAIEAGASPVLVPTEPIIHLSAHSFSSSADARIAYLRGRMEFQQRWWSPWRANLGGAVRRAGILGRVLIARAAAPARAAEITSIWRNRDEWSRGVQTPRRGVAPDLMEARNETVRATGTA